MNGEVLGDRYQVQQQLGKHAGRQTLLACDLNTQELVVVKLLSLGSDFEWEHLKLFEREAETLKALSHPAIPGYLDYFELNSPNGKGFALVQTYVEGRSLEEHLKAGRSFSEAEVRQLAKDLLEILIYLHGRQPPVIHRDIKPSNILLTNRSGNSVGQVYLVDFGSVQTLAAKEGGTITVVGTYGYMPPEQFGGRAVPASDLYSLGATLIYLVTGTHPADLPQKDLRIQFQQVANLSPAFADWLKWMTQPSLDRRLASAGEALQALEKPQQRDVAPLVVRQPTGSKVLLRKDADALEIIIPSARFNLGSQFFYLCGIALVLFFFSGYDWSFYIPLLFFLVGLPCLGIVKDILFKLFGIVRLSLNLQQISLTYELFGFKYHRRPSLTYNISKLERIKRAFKKDSEDNNIEIPPEVIIWAGTQKYQLRGDEDSLSEPELDWLAYELSDWLGLPIIRE